MYYMIQTQIATFAKFSVLKILFHLTRVLLSELCTKNVTMSTHKFNKVALNCLKKIQEVNSKPFNHSHQIKAHKLEQLTGPPITCDLSLESLNTVVTIPENLPLSDTEKSVLSKGLKFVPMSKKLDDFSIEQDVEKFLCHMKLNVFFHDKEGNSNTSNKDIFETLQTRNSKWTPPRGSVRLFRYFHQ